MDMINETENIEINEQVLNTLKSLIINAERDNLKTKKYTSNEMIDVIKRIIEKNVK